MIPYRLRSLHLFFLVLATLILAVDVFAIGYNDFPPELQVILDQRITEINANGGMCTAGRVTFSDGAVINSGADVHVVYEGAPNQVFAEGYFIMTSIRPASWAGSNKQFFLRAFAYDPINAQVTTQAGQISYVEFMMNRTPTQNLASVSGTVLDELSRPLMDANVVLSFPFATILGEDFPLMQLATESDGQYSFSGITPTDYVLVASSPDYAFHSGLVNPPVAEVLIANRVLYPNRRIGIDYVYQPDGSTSFAEPGLQAGTVNWLRGTGGFNFSKGHVQASQSDDQRDLELRQSFDQSLFGITYFNSGPTNGYYDAGLVDFDSVTTAAASGYTTGSQPCLMNHVYVVRTYEGHYAKLIVRTSERSFCTVVPGDPDPIEFDGYGLIVDFATAGDHGRLYAEKVPSPAPQLAALALPHYWDIHGMEGVAFSADLTISYDDAEVLNQGLTEASLALLRSPDGGDNWYRLEAALNSSDNALTAGGLTAFSLFALADLDGISAADFDFDGDVDEADYDKLGPCVGGPEVTTPPDSCSPERFVVCDFDDDGDVDLRDLAEFQLASSG